MKYCKGIYILTNTVNGRQYVGKDSHYPRRVKVHLRGAESECRAIHNAIQKYGSDVFSVEFISYPNISDQLLSFFERSHIAELNTKNPNGYNLTDGGEGGINPSDETRHLMSENKRYETPGSC